MGIFDAISVKTSHYIIGAIGLVAAFSWNDAIKGGLSYIFPDQHLFLAKIVNALIITIFLIIIIHFLPDTRTELPIDTQKKIHERDYETSHESMVNRTRKKFMI